MQDIDTGATRSALDLVSNPREWSLFIDIDGTLLSVAPTPDAVVVPAGLVPLLGDLARGFGGAVALVTGRRLADADRLFAPLKLVAAGVHGTEVRRERDGPIHMLAQAAPTDFIHGVNEIAASIPGVLVEPKGAGVAVHYRNAPQADAKLVSDLGRIVAKSAARIILRPGRKVIEAVPYGFSKGTALTALASEAPFRNRYPIMIGDDHGDESALRAAERLGGIGLRVAGEHFSAQEADFDGVESVLKWLSSVARRLNAARVHAEDPSTRQGLK